MSLSEVTVASISFDYIECRGHMDGQAIIISSTIYPGSLPHQDDRGSGLWNLCLDLVSDDVHRSTGKVVAVWCRQILRRIFGARSDK